MRRENITSREAVKSWRCEQSASKSIYEQSAEEKPAMFGSDSELEKRFFCGTLDGNSLDNTRMGDGTRSDK